VASPPAIPASQVGISPPIQLPTEDAAMDKPELKLNRYVRSFSPLFSIRKGPIVTPVML